MGDRYNFELTCPKCGFYDNDVWYAPTCGVIEWICKKCGFIVDLEEYTGISKEEASNKAEIESIIKNLTRNMEGVMSINPSNDTINLRDVISRIQELEDEWDSLDNEERLHWDEKHEELTNLKALAEQCEDCGNWEHGAILINDSYFTEYTQESVKDCYDLSDVPDFVKHNIDWDKAAEDMQQDYMSVDFDGDTFWIRV